MAKRVKGWTLVELVVTLVLIGLLSTLMMSTLQKPLEALFYVHRTLESMEPISWLNWRMTQILSEPVKSLQLSEQGDKLTLEDAQGGTRVLSCDLNTKELIYTLDVADTHSTGVLLNSVLCQFQLETLPRGTQVMLQLSLETQGESLPIQRIYYVHPLAT